MKIFRVHIRSTRKVTDVAEVLVRARDRAAVEAIPADDIDVDLAFDHEDELESAEEVYLIEEVAEGEAITGPVTTIDDKEDE